MPRLIIEDRRLDPARPIRVSCSCLGCLTALIVIAFGWMALHLGDIISFVTGG
jgi:hypothetical protein